jgi:glycosyltransferase involved in cell wall biosynthesis
MAGQQTVVAAGEMTDDPIAARLSATRRGGVWQFVDSRSIGGIERHIATLASALHRDGIATTILLYQDHGRNPWCRQLEAATLPYEFLNGRFDHLLRKLWVDRPALLHTHGYKAGILGRLAARLLGIPVVSTCHSGEKGAWPVSMYQRVDEWTSILGARIAVSTEIADRQPFGSTVVPNFVDMPECSPMRPPGKDVAYVGRLSHEKGPDLFCELAVRVGSGFNWHVYGDGPMKAELEARYLPYVQFHGLALDMEAVWGGVDVLVIPSRAEGLPMTALEAMARGIPVVCARVGALPDVVEHGVSGWLFDAGELAGAERGLAEFVSARAARGIALAQSCRDRIARNFSVDHGLSRVLDVYRCAGFIPRKSA